MSATMSATTRRDRFRSLHAGGLFVMPNPWDAGSARLLASLGFPALATTSSGHAASLGRADYGVSRDEMLELVAAVAGSVDVPINVDSERCFADDPAGVAETVGLIAQAGAAGCSIEDYDPAHGAIDPVEVAVDRVAAAAGAAARHGLVLTARAENHLHGITDLDELDEDIRAMSEPFGKDDEITVGQVAQDVMVSFRIAAQVEHDAAGSREVRDLRSDVGRLRARQVHVPEARLQLGERRGSLHRWCRRGAARERELVRPRAVVEAQRHGVGVHHAESLLVDLDSPESKAPPEVFATPTYVLDGKVVSLGNPTLEDLTRLLARYLESIGEPARIDSRGGAGIEEGA